MSSRALLRPAGQYEHGDTGLVGALGGQARRALKKLTNAWKSPGTRPYAMSRAPLRRSVRVMTNPGGSGT